VEPVFYIKEVGFITIGYILINVKKNHKKEVLEALSHTSDVVDVYPIYGDYDIIAKITAKSFAGLGKVIVRKILSIDSVLATKTYTAENT